MTFGLTKTVLMLIGLKMWLNQDFMILIFKSGIQRYLITAKVFLIEFLKTNHRLEPYLVLLDYSERINLCRFRCRNHKLPCIIDRFNINSTVDRTCHLCEQNTIGDEFHYLFECDKFVNDRVKYIPFSFRNNPNTMKMNHLFNSDNYLVLKKLSKFVSIIMSSCK